MNSLDSCLLCSRKHHCCINPPSRGYVAVSIDEAKSIRRKTGLSYDCFLTFRKLPGGIVRKSRADFVGSEAQFRASMMFNDRILRLRTGRNGECVFLKNGKCSIYSVRPGICRMYPFWFRNKKGRLVITVHSGCSYCGLIDKGLSRKDISQLRKTALGIERQRDYYVKHVLDFVRENKIT